MTSLIKNSFFVVCIIIANTAYARPISYAEGITVMQKNSPSENKLHVHYSPSIKNSVGVTVKRRENNSNPDNETDYIYGVQWNYLLARKNTEKSQANLYSKTELGYQATNQAKPLVSLEVAGDWETQRLFTSYNAKVESPLGDVDNARWQHSSRVGFAPYVADYNSLHTWLMLQTDHDSSDNKVNITPVVRLFKSNYLTELGINQDKDLSFNWVIRH